MASSCESLILLQNYPLYSMSTTSRRYERDRGQTTAARADQTQKQKQRVVQTNTATNDNDNLLETTKCFNSSAFDKQQQKSCAPVSSPMSNSHLATLSPMPSIMIKLCTSVLQLHGAFYSQMPNNNKKPLPTNNNININSIVKQHGNVKRFFTILIIAYIYVSLYNVHNGARMILCDKVSSYSNDKQTSPTGPFWYEAQTVTSLPTIKQHEQQQMQNTNLKKPMGLYTTNDDNNNGATNSRAPRNTIGSSDQSTQKQHQQHRASLTNQLLLLLAHPFINDNKQLYHYHHNNKRQYNNNDDKLLQDRNSFMTNNQRNNYNNNVNSLMPVTTSPVTATLMAPNLFTPVTPPTFAAPAIYSVALQPDQKSLPANSQTNRLLQTDAEFEAANLFANNQHLESMQQQSDLAMAMSELSPSLVFPVKNHALDTDPATSSMDGSGLYERHHHNPTLLPLLDANQFTSGQIQDSNPWPMVVADRNSVIATANTGEQVFNKSPTTNTAAENNQQGSSRVARKLRSLHDKTPNKNLAKPRGIMWEMATDTSLGVTLLHMMDRASFALPLGFFLMPIIQMMKSPSGGSGGGAASGALSLARLLPARASHRSVDYEDLVKRIDYVDKLLSKALRPSHRSAVIGRKR